MIGWMVRNFISREANVVLKIYETLIRPHIEYCILAQVPISRDENWGVILRLDGIQRIVRKIIKRIKDYSYRERLKRLGLTTLLTNGSGDQGSIPGRVMLKTQKMVLDASLLNTQHYKVWLKVKWSNPRKGVAPFPYTSV